MKFKAMMAVILAGAAVAFTGCAKDGGHDKGTEANGDNSIHMRIALPNSTRAVGEHVTNNALSVKPGFIYFTAGNIIKKVVKMQAADATNSNEVKIADLTSSNGATITGVPASVDKCHIFANIPAGTQTAMAGITVGSDISAVKNLSMDVTAMYDTAENGVANVPQWGAGDVTKVNPGADNESFTTTVQLHAIGARLQVAKISSANIAGTPEKDITSFVVEGIFVNNYYPTMHTDCTFDGITIANNGSSANDYDTAAGKAYETLGGALADVAFTTGLRPAGTVAAPAQITLPDGSTANRVWGYNVWPTDNVWTPTGAAKETLPHIVIRLNDIEVNGGQANAANGGYTITEPRFLTVKGLKEANDAVITAIKNGTAYTFTDIVFTFDNITTVPEEATINGIVKVEPIAWTEVPVKPEL